MNDIEKRALAVEAQLREQVAHHRDLSNPLYMSTHGRLLHEAAEVIAALTPPEGERLSESEKDVALAQAVEFAEYVERQAKGSMRDAAARFLSLPYAQKLAKRIAPEVSP